LLLIRVSSARAETARASTRSSPRSAGCSTRRASRGTPEIMMLGLSTRGSRKGRPRPSLPKRGRAPPLPSLSTSLARRRRAPRWRGCARSTSAPSPRCLRPPRRHRCRRRGPRRGYGAATSTCGSTTRSSRSWSRETRSEPSPSTGRCSGCVHGSLGGVQGQSEREREGKNLEKLKN